MGGQAGANTNVSRTAHSAHLGRSLWAALALHLALLAATALLPPVPRGLRTFPTVLIQPQASIEVVLWADEGLMRPPIEAGRLGVASRVPEPSVATSPIAPGGPVAIAESVPSPSVASGDPVPLAPLESGTPSDSPPSDDGYGVAAAVPMGGFHPGALGAIGVPSLHDPRTPLAPGAAAPDRAPTARFDPEVADKALDGALLTLDQQKGMAPPVAGIIARALEDEARAAPAPEEARVQFAAYVTSEGHVGAIEVVSFSAGQAEAWQGVASRATARLAGQTYPSRMRRDFRVMVNLLSRMLYPSGTTQPVEIADYAAGPSRVVHTSESILVDGKPAAGAFVEKTPGPWSFDERVPENVIVHQHEAPGRER